MSDKVFVDTNILVYSRDAAFPVKQRICHELLAGLWKNRTGRLSVQVCNEFFVTVTRKLKPGLDECTAWDEIETYFAWNPEPIDYKSLRKAREAQVRYHMSWWDSLIVASAFFSECTTIVSEDLSSGQEYFGIRVVNPFL
ncbi:MAG: VapC toxin family PIN domain ribonuclease [Spirochaetae bacterium HGW-Spirochaetae-7]|jgi:predicted nucleic acid-binding protein|nr:MAG: VapC toxin family PIN domain ribonuclease [Spirochaetae bacterium HGW-Spirochaetae-7]